MKFVNKPYYELSDKEIEVLISFGLEDPNMVNKDKNPNMFYIVRDYNRCILSAIEDRILQIPIKNSILKDRVLNYIAKRILIQKITHLIKNSYTVNGTIKELSSRKITKKEYKKIKGKYKKDIESVPKIPFLPIIDDTLDHIIEEISPYYRFIKSLKSRMNSIDEDQLKKDFDKENQHLEDLLKEGWLVNYDFDVLGDFETYKRCKILEKEIKEKGLTIERLNLLNEIKSHKYFL